MSPIEAFTLAPVPEFPSVVSCWLGIFVPTSYLLHTSGQVLLVRSGQSLRGSDPGADKDFIGGVRSVGVDWLLKPTSDCSQPDVFLLGAD